MFRFILIIIPVITVSCHPEGEVAETGYTFEVPSSTPGSVYLPSVSTSYSSSSTVAAGGGGYTLNRPSSPSGSSGGSYSYSRIGTSGVSGSGYSYSQPGSSGGGAGGGYSYNRPSGGGTPSPKYGAPAQTPTIHKHVYVHVPPPEKPSHKPKKPIHVAPPQKHYKIIFIKAPTPPTPTAPEIPAQPKDEQKTLIYVLVKKPDDEPDITIPTLAPTEPSKPEVYFIRYKTKKEEGAGGYPESIAPAGGIDFAGGIAAVTPSSAYGTP